MQTQILPIRPDAPEPDVIARAAAIIRGGGLVAFPTETVYGLGANAMDADSVARIFAAKGRPATNPIIVHITRTEDVARVASSMPEVAQRLAARFWPGPLSLVLPRRAEVPDHVSAGLATVAVRVPAHPVARALIESAGVPIAAPSANRSFRLSPTRAEHVIQGLNGLIDLVLDAGPTPGGIESTVLDVTVEPPCLLRPGLLTKSEVEAVIGQVAVPGGSGDETAAMPSPGMLSRHYAPRAPLECAGRGSRQRIEAWLHAGVSIGWLTFAEPADIPPGLTVEVMPQDPKAYSARLYAVLHAMDDAGVQRIVVDLPPLKDEWAAVRDRLRRAAE
jgi:L-threonylcarbamoyladenylate synthase